MLAAEWLIKFEHPAQVLPNVLTLGVWVACLISIVRTERAGREFSRWLGYLAFGAAFFIKGVFIPIGAVWWFWSARRRRLANPSPAVG